MSGQIDIYNSGQISWKEYRYRQIAYGLASIWAAILDSMIATPLDPFPWVSNFTKIAQLKFVDLLKILLQRFIKQNL